MKEFKSMKIISVDRNGFTFEDGTYQEHPVPLEDCPNLEDFQRIYDRSCEFLENALYGQDDINIKGK